MRTATEADIAAAADQLVWEFRARYPGGVFSYNKVTRMMRPGWWDLGDIRASREHVTEFYRAIDVLRSEYALKE